MQLLASAALNRPGGHAEHCADPRAENLPAAHTRQPYEDEEDEGDEAEGAEYRPAEQLPQPADPFGCSEN